jgi:hypothetical protein
MCHVVWAARRRPYRPVDAARGAVGRGEIWGHGHDGQVQVARVQRTKSDAGITGELFEHLVPSLPAEAIADPVQRPVCGCVPARDT